MTTSRSPRYFAGDVELIEVSHWSTRSLPEGVALTKIAKHGLLPIGRLPSGDRIGADRVIFYKSRPSLHKCDARCMNAKGHNCECSCGGANHGIAA